MLEPVLNSTISLSTGAFCPEIRNQIKIDLETTKLDSLVTQIRTHLHSSGTWRQHVLELLVRAAARPDICGLRTDSVTHTIHTATGVMLQTQSIVLGK